jgi:hypothetical protein
MAITNVHRKGFRFYKSVSGSTNPTIERITLASAYRPTLTVGASPVYVDLDAGTPIIRLSTGYGDISFGTESDTPSTRVLGVIVGFGPMYDGTKMVFNTFYPNAGITYSTNFERETVVHYIPAQSAWFSIDADEATTATTYAAYLAFKGETCRHNIATTASQALNKTDVMLDISDHNTTSTFTWRIEDVILNDPNNQDFSGANVKLIVSCNVPQTGVGSATGI